MRALPESETILTRLNQRIPREARLAFLYSLGVGLFTHLYMLVNKLPNHDDIIGLFQRNENTVSGRWFSFFPSAISSSFSTPWVTGALALLWLALAAVCVVRMLSIKKPVMIFLTAAVMTTFPTVCYTLCYMFTADAYLFALFLAALGAYLSDRYRWGFLVGGVCIGLSLAIYQAYVFFAIGLFALRMLLLLLFPSEDGLKLPLIKLAQFAAALLLGALVYRVGLTASLALRHATLKTYMGLDNAGSVSIIDALTRIPLGYKGYLNLFRGSTDLLSGRLNAGLFILANLAAVVLFILSVLRASGAKRPLHCILAAGIMCLLPLVFNGISLLSTMGLHPLMQYPICLAFVLAIALYDHLASREEPAVTLLRQFRTLVGYGLTLCVIAAAFLFAVDANQTYLALELKFQNMMSLVTRMVDRVEQLPEYVPNETPVWYTGTLSDGNYGTVKSGVFARASATDMTGREWNYTFLMNNLYFRAFTENYVGVSFVAPDDAEADAALETAAYQAMPYFPEAGSVASINGIIIINGGPNPQSPP